MPARTTDLIQQNLTTGEFVRSGPTAAQSAPHVAAFAARTVQIAALAASAIGTVALTGWAFDLPRLRGVLPDTVDMKANAAVAVVLAGIALLVLGSRSSGLHQIAARMLALAVAAIGLATICEYAFAPQSNFDEFLFRDAATTDAAPGRMSPFTAAALASIGIALAALPRPALRIGVWLASLPALAVGSISLLGYVWNVSELISDDWLHPVAANTAVALLLLGAGTLIATGEAVRRQAGTARNLDPVEMKILASFLGTLLLLVVGSGYTYRASVRFTDSAELVAHTQELRAALGPLYSALSDTETWQRNYLITGRDPDLAGYAATASKTNARYEALLRLVAERPSELKSLAELRPLIAARLGFLAREVDIYQRDGIPAAGAFIAAGAGTEVMQTILDKMERLELQEEELLTARTAALILGRQTTLSALLLTLLVAAGIFALLFRKIRRELLAGAKAQGDIVAAMEIADTANKAKSTFLATMSHEIRTPMNGVLGMLELLSLMHLEPAQQSTLEVVRESSKTLLRIIDDILDFSKIEAGKLEIRPETASITAILDHVLDMYAGNASSQGLLLSRFVDPRISPAVLVDPLRLRQILNNFVSNALKFTASGTIRIGAELVERDGGRDRVRFSVHDTGTGISAENQKRLFLPFSQVNGSEARRAGGTGLGLTICRRLSDLMGGSVSLVSVPGRGTSISLVLALPIGDPMDLPDACDKRASDYLVTTTNMRRMAPSVEKAEAEGTLVLVVDDHPTNRTLLTRQVDKLGYATESAGNGLEALEKWKSSRFGIVITDCNMPEMDGYELARAIRALESVHGPRDGKKRTPILACTANALAGEGDACVAAGMDDLLVKPVTLSQLLAKLDQWLPIPDEAGTAARFPGTAPGETPARDSVNHSTDPIDRAALSEISGGDALVEREILSDFRRANDRDATMLKRAVAAGELLGVKRATHRILGAGRMVGARGLCRACECIERAGQAADLTELAASIPDFHHERLRLNAYIDSL